MKPLYVSLTQVLLKKVAYPENLESWTPDEREVFRCYRQDISDTFVIYFLEFNYFIYSPLNKSIKC